MIDNQSFFNLKGPLIRLPNTVLGVLSISAPTQMNEEDDCTEMDGMPWGYLYISMRVSDIIEKIIKPFVHDYQQKGQYLDINSYSCNRKLS